MSNINVFDGGVTSAKGFKACAVEANIKYSGRTDMALVYSEVPAVTAATFTTNVVKAAPVKWDIKLVKEYETAQAVVLNSGIANACTGVLGDENNEIMAKSIAENLGIEKEAVLTASTGVIGMHLPADKVVAGAKKLVEGLADTREAAHEAALAIMTTDTVCKEYAVKVDIDGKEITIGGMCKGSGMIHPNMATMLSVVTTDANISKEMLQKMVSEKVNKTFNMISVDRDTSTNDSFMVLANGLAENEKITSENEAYKIFADALEYLMTELAKIMASDGEGATRLFETKVLNAASYEDAVYLAKSVITSNLVKTAIYGADANWGRIVCAMGYSGVDFDPDKVDLYIESSKGKLKLFENGMATDYSEDVAKEILLEDHVIAIADMNSGEYNATAWGCDLTYEYVKINGDYRS